MRLYICQRLTHEIYSEIQRAKMLFDTIQHARARALRKHRTPLAFVEQVSRQTRHSEDGGWKRLAHRRDAGDSRQ